MGKKLTKRQREIYNYVVEYINKNNFPPSIREIGAAFGLSSPATVHTHLKNLECAGYIQITENKFRAIKIIGKTKRTQKDREIDKLKENWENLYDYLLYYMSDNPNYNDETTKEVMRYMDVLKNTK